MMKTKLYLKNINEYTLKIKKYKLLLTNKQQL